MEDHQGIVPADASPAPAANSEPSSEDQQTMGNVVLPPSSNSTLTMGNVVPPPSSNSTLNLIGGVPHISRVEHYHSSINHQGRDWIVYKHIPDFVVPLSVATMKTMLTTTPDGWIDWRPGRTGAAATLRNAVASSSLFPPHVALSMDQPIRVQLGANRNLQRRDSCLKDLVFGKKGYCCASKTESHCPTMVAIGWTKSALDKYLSLLSTDANSPFHNDDKVIDLSFVSWHDKKMILQPTIKQLMAVASTDEPDCPLGCFHILGLRYGHLSGIPRQDSGRTMVVGRTAPSQHERDRVSSMGAAEYHTGNAQHNPPRATLRKVKSQAMEKEMYEKYGLTPGKNDMDNVILALRHCVDRDTELRTESGDPDRTLMGFSEPIQITAETFSMILFGLNQCRSYRVVGARGYLVVNFDGSGGLLSFDRANTHLRNNPIQHFLFHVNTKYMLSKVLPERMRERGMKDMMPPLVALERVSDKNTAVELAETLNKFVDAAARLDMPEYPMSQPIVGLTDCAPQLQAAMMFVFNKHAKGLDFAVGSKNKGSARMVYSGISGHLFLKFESTARTIVANHSDSSDGRATRRSSSESQLKKLAASIRAILLSHGICTILKMCRSHICRAVLEWGRKKGPILQNLYFCILDRASNTNSLAESVAIFSVLKAALESRSCPVMAEYYGASQTKGGKDASIKSIEADVDACAGRVESFIEKETNWLLDNYSKWDPMGESSFSSMEWPDFHHESIIQRAKSEIGDCLIKCYLLPDSKDSSKEGSLGIAKGFIILGRQSSKDQQSMVVRFSKSGIGRPWPITLQDPIPNVEETIDYINKTWISPIVLWTRSGLHILEVALGIEIEGSNQYSEAGFKDMKFNQTATHVCHDLPPYLCDRHRYFSDSMKVFARNVAFLETEIQKKESYGRPHARQQVTGLFNPDSNTTGTKRPRAEHQDSEEQGPTALDAANDEEHSKTVFDRRGGDSAGEKHRSLVSRLYAKYWSLPKTTTGQQRKMPPDGRAPNKALFEAIATVTGKTIPKFGYQPFNNWMSGRRDKVPNAVMEWVQTFLSHDGQNVHVD